MKGDNDIQDLLPQISEAHNKCNEIRQRSANKEKELSQAASKLADSVYQLKQVDQDISAYVEKVVPINLLDLSGDHEFSARDPAA
jgi:chromosome segregation ATPase